MEDRQGLFNSSTETVFLYMAILNMHQAKETLGITLEPSDGKTQLAAR